MKHIRLLLMALASAALFVFSWQSSSFPFLILLAFIPLFFIEHVIERNHDHNKPGKIFFYSWVTFFLWNLSAISWTMDISIFIWMYASIVISILMALVFLIFHITKRHTAYPGHGYFAFVIYWMAFEYFLNISIINWPVMELGTAFANYPQFIQFFEFTGISGGSLWILLCNVLILYVFDALFYFGNRNKAVRIAQVSLFLIILLGLPGFSYYLYTQKTTGNQSSEISLVQPGKNPMNDEAKIAQLIPTAQSQLNKNTTLLIFPEHITNPMQYEKIIHKGVDIFNPMLDKNPRLKIILPFSKIDPSNNFPGSTLDLLIISQKGTIHKQIFSRNMPGFNTLPIPPLGFMLAKLTNKNYKMDSHALVQEKTTIQTEIPSGKAGIFADQAILFNPSELRELSATSEILIQLSNNIWWDSDKFNKQSLSLARLAAISHKRPVGHVTHKGITTLIGPKGNIKASINEKTDAISATLPIINRVSFYTKYGNYLGRIFLFFSGLLVLYTIVSMITRKSKK